MRKPPTIRLVIPYFGRFPSYFNLFLHSCRLNPDINWLLITDCQLSSDQVPPNVTVHKTTLENLIQRIRSAVDTPISIPKPYKLCDFRPAYGVIFAQELQGWDFWGHCDVDVIFGQLRKFLTPELLEQHNKIQIVGSLSLYRNDEQVNNYFRLPTPQADYRNVFADPRSRVFDEWQGMYLILRHHNLPFFHQRTFMGNFESLNYHLTLTGEPDYKHQIFYWENGATYQEYWLDGQHKKHEFAYLHIQKRQMIVPDFDPISAEHGWYITPKRFLPKLKTDMHSPEEMDRLNQRRPIHDIVWQLNRPIAKMQRLLRERKLVKTTPPAA